MDKDDKSEKLNIKILCEMPWGKYFHINYNFLSLLQNPEVIKEKTDKFWGLGALGAACGILASQAGTELTPPVFEVQSPNRWTTRKFPRLMN